MDEKTDFEKLIDSVSQLAATVKVYYQSLREQGFTHKDAMQLTSEYQKSIIEIAKPVNK